jgi:hypothetical protein
MAVLRQVDAWRSWLGPHLAPVAHLMLAGKLVRKEGVKDVHGAFLVLYPIPCEATGHPPCKTLSKLTML